MRGGKKHETACFTGHRDIPVLLAEDIAKRTRKAVVNLVEKGYKYVPYPFKCC